jgi:hypothetical protein
MPANSAAAPAFDGGLSRSVGRNSPNLSDDVLAVQILLNNAGAAIQENGSCDRATISAIEEYQRNWTDIPTDVSIPAEQRGNASLQAS